MFCPIVIYIKGYVRFQCLSKVNVMFHCFICPWVCSIMVVLVDVSCCITRFNVNFVMGGFSYALNHFVVFQCALSVMLCYIIHKGPYCIATWIKCYVVLQHLWRCTLYCNIFRCSCCLMVRFINCFSWIVRFNQSAFVGFQHASRV